MQKHYQSEKLRENCPDTDFLSGPYFPVFGLNTEIYSLNLRIQSEYRKIRTRKNSVFGHFSRSEIFQKILSIKDYQMCYSMPYHTFSLKQVHICIIFNALPQVTINPFSANFTKQSYTLKQFVGNLSTNCLSVFDHLVGLALKGLSC